MCYLAYGIVFFRSGPGNGSGRFFDVNHGPHNKKDEIVA